MQLHILESISGIPAEHWNRLEGTQQPFLRHEFLLALEESGCVGAQTGWIPQYLIGTDGAGGLAAAMPLYLKMHSRGEFVFDFAWADAYQRAGLAYYPKLVSAVPFTPVTGARLLVAPQAERPAILSTLARAAVEQAETRGLSSLHVLFPSQEDARTLEDHGLLLRKDCQFHWRNRDYTDFDDFLDHFTAAKRKKARRERRRVREAGISFELLHGGDISSGLWKDIMPLYASTFWHRGHQPYLNESFFRRIAQALPEHFLVVLARRHGELVAIAIFFRSTDTLYGRYWGSSGDFHSLHFETCYYQGIEYCIAEGLQRFEPGTQGEHKIARGFEATEVHSAHWLADPRFAAAIERYLEQERIAVNHYMEEVRAHSPFRQESA